MVTNNGGGKPYVSDDDRRDFLKALGVAGSVAVGGAGLQDVREEMTTGSSAELASIGQAIQADLDGTMDGQLISDHQGALAGVASELPAAVERGLPETEQRQEFSRVAEPARPIYEHLASVGFFESTTERLPAFDPAYLESTVSTFVNAPGLADPLADHGLTDGAGADLLAEVIANAGELSDVHWVATDEIPRDEIEFGEYIPPMTQGAAGGALLWLEDLDQHLQTHHVLLTEDILADAVWHGQSLAAGLQLMAEGAKVIATEDATVSDDELAALLSTGFAVQAIGQGLLPQDVYWVTEEMRDDRRTDIQRVGASSGGN